MVIYRKNIKKSFNSFLQSFKNIKAAGGIVLNEKNEILFIFRNGKWDLPKGKLSKGEKKSAAAIREVEEETGILIDRITQKVGTTVHMYLLDGEWVIKKTTWYQMIVKNASHPSPQLEEGITEVRFFSRQQLQQPLANTYPLIINLLKNHLDQ